MLRIQPLCHLSVTRGAEHTGEGAGQTPFFAPGSLGKWLPGPALAFSPDQ